MKTHVAGCEEWFASSSPSDLRCCRDRAFVVLRAAPPASQARSRLTQDRIFAAGTALLEAGGVEALTVAAEAGVAVGSVYRRFGDKDRLLLAIQARFTEDFRGEVHRRMNEADLARTTSPVEVVSAAVLGVASTFESHAALMRVLMLLGTRNPGVFAQGASSSVAGGRSFRDTRMLIAPALRHHPDVETAIDFAYRLTYSTCAHRIIAGEHLESARPSSWPELIEQLRLALTAYLLTPPGAGPSTASAGPAPPHP